MNDIEDVSEQYQMYLGIEAESDSVNRILLPELIQENEPLPLYLISLIEHKSSVEKLSVPTNPAHRLL